MIIHDHVWYSLTPEKRSVWLGTAAASVQQQKQEQQQEDLNSTPLSFTTMTTKDMTLRKGQRMIQPTKWTCPILVLGRNAMDKMVSSGGSSGSGGSGGSGFFSPFHYLEKDLDEW